LSISGYRWNDSGSQGDSDTVIEAGERPRLKIRLRSNDHIEHIDAFLLSNDSEIAITDADVYYDNFDTNDSQWSVGWFSLDLNFSLNENQTQNSDFTLHVTYQKNGQEYYQNLSFSEEFYWQDDHGSFQMLSYTIDDSPSIFYRNNGDGILQSGEEIHIRPLIQYSGLGAASIIDVTLLYDGPIFENKDEGHGYPDLTAGISAYPEDERYYSIYSADLGFTGIVYLSVQIDWDERDEPVLLPDAIQLDVNPTPILSVHPGVWNFGVVAPGNAIEYTMRVRNVGSGTMTVMDVQTSDADTTILVEDRSFIIAPGSYRDIPVTINTDAIVSGASISRQVQVISEANLIDNTPPSNRVVITGLVSNEFPIYGLTGVTGSQVDISDNIIAWVDNRNGNGDIYAYDLGREIEYAICTNSANQAYVRLSGSLIAWEDLRNWDGQGTQKTDIYAYDLKNDQEIIVDDSPADKNIIGVDGDIVAYTKQDFTYDSYGNQEYAYNVYYFNVKTGDRTQLTHYSRPPSGSDLTKATSDIDSCDFADGIIVWKRQVYAWKSEFNTWSSGYHQQIEKYKIGIDTSPVLLDFGFDSLLRTAGGKIVWDMEDNEGDQQLWIWENGQAFQLTNNKNVNHEYPVLGNDYIVYQKNTLYIYRDIITGAEELIVDTGVNIYDWRMDGNTIVWAYGGKIKYALLGDVVALSPTDISISNIDPTDSEPISVTVTVHNISSNPMTENVVVKLFSGNPDDGGLQLASDEIIDGGIEAFSQVSVTFAAVMLTEGISELHVTSSISGKDNQINNTAVRSVEVADDDSEGPVIFSIVVAEYEGDGDGIIGDDEKIRISWQLQDSSLIGSTSLTVNENSITLDGDYFAIIEPLLAGDCQFAINATDADNSPETSTATSYFEVVQSEIIEVMRGSGETLENGSTIDLGTFLQGSQPQGVPLFILNKGEQNLSLTNLIAPEGFQILVPHETNILPGNYTSFAIKPNTDTLGLIPLGQVILENSDNDRNPFSFNITAQINAVKGDIDADGDLDLTDAILAFQVLVGMSPGEIRSDYVSSGADVNGENPNKIGIEEALYILQKLSMVRP